MAQYGIKVSLSSEQARTWYEQTTSPANTAARQTDKPIVLDWQHSERVIAGTTELLLVPILDTRDRFKRTPYRAVRRLAVSQQPGQAPIGLIMEVLTDKQAVSNPTKQAALFAQLYTQQRQPAHLSSFTGAVLYYNFSYQYLTGRRYEQGEPQAGRARLVFYRPAGVLNPSTTPAPAFAATGDGDDDPDDALDGGEIIPEVIIIGSAPTEPSYPGGPITIPGGGDYGGWGGNGPADYPNDPGGGTPGGGGGISPLAPKVVSIDVTGLPDCATQVVNKLQQSANNPNSSNNPISELIRKIGSSNAVTVKIQAGNIPDNGGQRVGARIESYIMGSNSYTMTVNNATLLGDVHGSAASDVGLASAIIHEYLHIYMHDWAQQHTQLGPNASLDEIMRIWFQTNGIYGPQQEHQTMAQFVGLMGQATAAYYNETHTQLVDPTYFMKLAWIGLSKTDAYN